MLVQEVYSANTWRLKTWHQRMSMDDVSLQDHRGSQAARKHIQKGILFTCMMSFEAGRFAVEAEEPRSVIRPLPFSLS